MYHQKLRQAKYCLRQLPLQMPMQVWHLIAEPAYFWRYRGCAMSEIVYFVILMSSIDEATPTLAAYSILIFSIFSWTLSFLT